VKVTSTRACNDADTHDVRVTSSELIMSMGTINPTHSLTQRDDSLAVHRGDNYKLCCVIRLCLCQKVTW